MATRKPGGSAGARPPTPPPDDDDDLDQDTEIGNVASVRALLEEPARAAPQAAQPPRRPTPRPAEAAQPPQRPTPPPRKSAPALASPPRRTAPTPAAAQPVAPPKLLQRTDIVPEFRRDLRIERIASGVQVTDDARGTTHTLNEYEASLARMLNGKRPVFDVLENAERLGIPINIESFQKFLNKLDAIGLLLPPESLDAAVDNAWPSRGQWESNVRTLFQSGIRFLRQGKHQEAIGYFEAMLAEDPDNVEAQELLAMAQQGLHAPPMSGHFMTPSAPMPVVVPVVVPPVPVAPSPEPAPYPAPAPPQYAPSTPHVYSPPIASPLPQQLAQGLGSKRMLLAAAGVLASVVIAFVVVRALKGGDQPAVVATNGSAKQTASSDIPIAKPDAALAGARAGSAIAEIGSAETGSAQTGSAKTGSAEAGSAETGSAETGSAETGSASETGSAATGSGTEETGSATEDPMGSAAPAPEDGAKPATVVAPMAGDVTAYLAGPATVKKGQKLFAISRVSGDPAKIKEATAKVAEMQKLAKQDEVYLEFLTTAKKELAAVRKVTTTVVTASKAGKATPKVKSGARVQAGQLLVEIR